MKIKDIIKSFSGESEEVKKKPKAKAKPKAKPKAELNEETPGLVPINKYARPFEVTGTGILFPDGTVQNSAQGGSAGIDPELVTQVQQNTADIAKNAEDIAAIEIPEIPEMPEIPDSIDAYTKAEVDASQAAQDTEITKKAPQDTTYTKDEVDSSQGAQDAQIASKAPQASTYTKTEVDASQAAQDTKIAKNLTDIAKNKTDIKSNSDNITKNKSSIDGLTTSLASTKNDVIELEEEIEALAPSFDRGHWAHDTDTEYPRPPLEGHYYVVAGTEHTDSFADVTEIVFSNKDKEDPPHTHTFSDVEVGQMIEVFEGADSSFMLAEVKVKNVNDTYSAFAVEVIKSQGGPGLEEPDNPDVSNVGAPGVIRVKFFSLSEAELNLSGYMPKAGGWFTGGIGINWKEPGYMVEPLVIFDNHDNKVIRMWNTGAIETSVKTFRNKDLVTREYVDGKTDPTSVTCQQNWGNASWNIDNMVDALVSQIKVHNDRTALVLNKNGTDTTITMDWENELAPYPSYLGIKIDDEIYFVEVEFTGKGGTNNRGYNFKILAHNLPDNVANDTVVGICAGYKPESLTIADYQNFMPDGGTFTGQVKHKKDIVIEPTLPSRFVNIKNRYATDADGNNSGGSDNTQFGVNFDLDHGNSGYNTVKWTTRNGNVFAVYGGTQANAKYTGVIIEDSHLVNKGYIVPKEGGAFTGKVEFKKPYLDNESGLGFLIKGAIGDNYSTSTVSEQDAELLGVFHNINGVDAINYRGKIDGRKNIVTKEYVDDLIEAIPGGLGELYTLQTNGNSYLFDNGTSAPTDNSFRTESTSLQYNKKFHLKKLYESSGANAFLKDYEATPSSMFEIYDRGVLQARTSIKNFVASSRGNDSMMFDVSGSGASVHNYSSLTSNKAYQVILTNMRKKTTTRTLRDKVLDKTKKVDKKRNK